ncbi:hypothetical protein J6590_073425 [Homalodisca vitripennis]|nr:hypothetical protein J6590_073425 [Homalodisca vitripennis]
MGSLKKQSFHQLLGVHLEMEISLPPRSCCGVVSKQYSIDGHRSSAVAMLTDSQGQQLMAQAKICLSPQTRFHKSDRIEVRQLGSITPGTELPDVVVDQGCLLVDEVVRRKIVVTWHCPYHDIRTQQLPEEALNNTQQFGLRRSDSEHSRLRGHKDWTSSAKKRSWLSPTIVTFKKTSAV